MLRKFLTSVLSAIVFDFQTWPDYITLSVKYCSWNNKTCHRSLEIESLTSNYMGSYQFEELCHFFKRYTMTCQLHVLQIWSRDQIRSYTRSGPRFQFFSAFPLWSRPQNVDAMILPWIWVSWIFCVSIYPKNMKFSWQPTLSWSSSWLQTWLLSRDSFRNVR